MVLSSLKYLIFLPVVFILYWSIFRKNKNLQNSLILLASLLFYGCWDLRFLGLILLTAFSTFYAGRWMSWENISKKKWILVFAIVLNVGILFGFKYCNFFISSLLDLSSLLGIVVPLKTLKIFVPVGISFYTFAALSYCIDIYQQRIEPTKDLLAYLAYITFFPSLLSGPIGRATKQLPQFFEHREFNYNTAVNALKLILWGLFMKLCVADRLGIYVDDVYRNIQRHSGSTLLLTSILYTIQIYADFAGYSLIAIGSGKLLGIELLSNFEKPYFANTITEFWRRWHISLTTWFRDYIYIPLGGNRVRKSRWMLNTMIVFVVSGLWHGADYSFLVWGGIHGLLMILERLIYGDKMKELGNNLSLLNILRIVFTFCLVSFSWIFFRADNISEAILFVMGIFQNGFSSGIYCGIGKTYMVITLILTFVMFAKDYIEFYCNNSSSLLNNRYAVVRYASYIAIVLILLEFATQSQRFIYFQF